MRKEEKKEEIATKRGSNKNIKVIYSENNENTRRQSMGHIVQFRIVNPHQGPLINWQ